MKLSVALKGWVQVCPDGKIGQRVGVGLIAGEDGVCDRADVETPLIVRTL